MKAGGKSAGVAYHDAAILRPCAFLGGGRGIVPAGPCPRRSPPTERQICRRTARILDPEESGRGLPLPRGGGVSVDRGPPCPALLCLSGQRYFSLTYAHPRIGQ